jgi:hypothetical protein
MTAIVGLLCKDGIVIGSDSSATFTAGEHFRTIEQLTKKITIIEDRVIIACTGQIGLAQRFSDCVGKLWSNSAFRSKPQQEIVREFCKAGVMDFGSTQAGKGQIGALIAFPSGDKHHLCEFQLQDFQPELKSPGMWFVSMGSGQAITDPFLGLLRRVFWATEQPTVSEGKFAVTWTLRHVIELNPGGINGPPQIAVLEHAADGKLKAKILDDAEISEHMENAQEAEKHLGKYRDLLHSSGSEAIPPSPVS